MGEKFIIYQLLPRIFGNTNSKPIPGGSFSENGSGKFSDIDENVLKEIKKLSVTHIWYTGVISHATSGDKEVKGEAGSPYAIKDYYSVCPYLADDPNNAFQEYCDLIERTHKSGFKVIIDFVPNHLSPSYFSETDNFTDINYYPDRRYDYTWSDTVKLNYQERDTWEKMVNILLFWARNGADGFRCDMPELVPNEFWKWAIERVKREHPGTLFIAEIYQLHNYNPYINELGFDYLYDKSGLYDTLRSILTQGTSAIAITENWQRLADLQPHMLNFLENHDEQRIASDFFLSDPFKALPALYISLLQNTTPFLLYSGQEFGERGMDSEGFSTCDGRSSIFDFWSISTVRRWINGVREGDSTKYLSTKENGLYYIYKKLLSTSMTIGAFRTGLSFDLGYANKYDRNIIYAFLRFDEKELYLCAVNFSDTEAQLSIAIPEHAFQYLNIFKDEELNPSRHIDLKVAPKDAFILKLK